MDGVESIGPKNGLEAGVVRFESLHSSVVMSELVSGEDISVSSVCCLVYGVWM